MPFLDDLSDDDLGFRFVGYAQVTQMMSSIFLLAIIYQWMQPNPEATAYVKVNPPSHHHRYPHTRFRP